MPRAVVRDNYRVVVTTMHAADAAIIRDQIVRHVDVHSNDVTVRWDTYEVCSFCTVRHPMWRWEVDANGCPTCCTEAQVEWRTIQNHNAMAGKLPA